jgi:hypothetical protein
LGLGAALVLVGCGGASGSTVTVISSAGSATEATGTFRISIQGHTHDTASPAKDVESGMGDGVVDLTTKSYDVTTTSTSSQPADAIPGAPAGASQQTEQLVIGADIWTKGTPLLAGSIGGPSKLWLHIRRPGGSYASTPGGFDPVGLLDRLKAHGSARVVGHDLIRGTPATHYTFVPSAPPPTNAFNGHTTIDIWVDSQDLVRQVVLTVELKPQPENQPPTPDQTVVETVQFYDFGTPVHITPPRASEVQDLPAGPITPPCPTGSTVPCLQASPSTTVPSLPAPTITGKSPLQLRPVLSSATAGCASLTTDPPEDQPATVGNQDGRVCYSLGPAAMTITSATVEPESDVSGLQVSVILGPGDAASLDRLASANYQKQVAMVMFGKVLASPTINATQFNGQMVISSPNGFDPQTAANIKAALAG